MNEFEQSLQQAQARRHQQAIGMYSTEQEQAALTARLEASRGTDPHEVLGDDTDFALEFLRKMIQHEMPGSIKKAIRSRRISDGTKVEKRLFGKDRIIQGKPIIEYDYIRTYEIGAVSDGTGWDDGVFMCEDARLRSHVATTKGGGGIHVIADLIDKEDFTSGYSEILGGWTGEKDSDSYMNKKVFHPVPLRELLADIAARNLS